MPPVKIKKAAQAKPKSSASPQKVAQPKVEAGRNSSIADEVRAYAKMANNSPRNRGKTQVIVAEDYTAPYELRRPTGILGLDLKLGGGFPAGGPSQVFGARSSGKTHLCFCVAGQIQKLYGDASLITLGISEQRADVGFMRMSGFCVRYSDHQIREYENIRVANGHPPFTAEEKADLRHQVGEVIFLQGATGGDMLDGTLDIADHFGSRCQLMIIDSLGSLLTAEQDEKSVSDKHYGGSSGIITLWLAKMMPKYNNNRADGSMLETTILGINQVRAQIGGPIAGATRAAAGSKAWEHAQLASVEFKQGEPLWKDTKHTEQSGKAVKWSIKKGKAGCHEGSKGEFNWYYFKQNGEDAHDPVFWKDVVNGSVVGGADKITDLVDAAKSVGIIEVGGAWRTVKDQEGKIIVKAQGDEAFAEKVVNDPELEAMLRDGCLRASNLTIRYR